MATYSCAEKPTHDEPEAAAANEAEMGKRGEFLVNVGGCNDCYTPKIMTDQGPAFDMSKMLSGLQANIPLAPYDAAIVGSWILMHPQLTAAVGPWELPLQLTFHRTKLV